jgi:capsule polysaccharide export protein KpsE/RkpR
VFWGCKYVFNPPFPLYQGGEYVLFRYYLTNYNICTKNDYQRNLRICGEVEQVFVDLYAILFVSFPATLMNVNASNESPQAHNSPETSPFSPQAHEHSLRDDIMRIIALLVQERMLILALTLVAVLSSGVITYFFMPNWYASTVNAVPPRRAGGGLDALTGGLSSALKDVGLARVGSKSGSESYAFTVILNSRRMKDTIITLFKLHKIYDLDSNEWTDLRKMYDEHVFVTNEPDGNYLITALHTDRKAAAEMATKIYELGNQFADELFQQESRTSLVMMERRFAQSDKSLSDARDTLMRFSRRYKLYAPLDQAKSAASAIADLRVQQYKQELAVDISRSVYGEQDGYTQIQRQALEKINQQASRAENQSGFAGNFALSASSDITLEYMRLYADLEVFTKIKALLIPSMEQNRQDLQRRQPSLVMLDPAVPSDKKDRPKRSLIVGGATLGTLIFAIAFVILRDRFRALRGTYRALIESEMKKIS